MKLTVLVDNNTLIDQCYVGEPGVCYYIENNNDKILFDTGYSNVFIENARTIPYPLHLRMSISDLPMKAECGI